MADLHPTFEMMVRRLDGRVPLDEADRTALLSLPHTVRRLGAAGHVVRDRDTVEQCTLLLSGFAYRYKLTGEGGRQIISFHIPSEFLDLQNSLLRCADHSVQTLTEAELAVIPAGMLQKLALERPNIARALWIDTLIDSSIFREWVINVGRRDSRTRIAHLLCEFALRLESVGIGDGRRYEMPMTQEQLADAVGLTSVHVNRVLRQLGEEGLISRDRRTIVLEDWHRLRAVGDFNERYLHFDRDDVQGG